MCRSSRRQPAAQVYTGRIDVTVKDGTGAVLPGVTVEAVGTQTDVARHRRQGRGALPQPRAGALHRDRQALRLHRLQERERAGRRRLDRAARRHAGRRRRDRAGRRHCRDAGHRDRRSRRSRPTSTSTSCRTFRALATRGSCSRRFPGIIVDRVNVGGAESGQQSNYQAKGANPDQNTWNMDGIAITDMGALGASPTYYDFDMFQEMQVTTGGADPAEPDAGRAAQLRPAQRHEQVARHVALLLRERQTCSPTTSSSDLFGQIASYNRVGEYKDWGFEGGGPIVQGSHVCVGRVRQDGAGAERLQLRQPPPTTISRSRRDATFLENISAKVTARSRQKSRANFTYFRGNKQKFGRGASGFRPDETTYNQDGPTDLFKVEVNQTLGSQPLHRRALRAYQERLFARAARRPRRPVIPRRFEVSITGRYGWYQTDRPQDNIAIEGNMFKGRHDLKFGFGWRKASVTSESGWPGDGVRTLSPRLSRTCRRASSATGRCRARASTGTPTSATRSASTG